MRALRGFWRSLTSMRTALILLLLLAVAAVPGSVLPQRNISVENVNGYLAAYPSLGLWLDRLWAFDVYASPWFSAIYLLLFISLVGCLVPRLRQHLDNVIRRPPDAPKRLDRLPHTATRTSEATAGEVAARWRRARWRTVVREKADGSVTVSAEKGYVKETGNLIFHFALLALLVGVAAGSWYGWHGNRLVVAGPDRAFCNTVQQYDESGLGARTGAEDLPPFCVTLNDFHAEYLDNGQPVSYTADISYVEGLSGPERPYRLEVNKPLRLDGANVYLLGHGYAPILRYTDRFGVAHTTAEPFLPTDGLLTSTGAFKFPSANRDPSGTLPRDKAQTGFQGVYLPTTPDTVDGTLSVYPAERKPGLTLVAYQGDLGLSNGLSQKTYSLDHRQIAAGRLTVVANSPILRPGDGWALPDGSKVDFLGTQQWITVSVRSDPGEPIVLAGAVGLLVGLMISLTGKRRRLWARVAPDAAGGSLITFGGLARTEYPGFAEEFERLTNVAGGDQRGNAGDADDARQPVAVGEKGS